LTITTWWLKQQQLRKKLFKPLPRVPEQLSPQQLGLALIWLREAERSSTFTSNSLVVLLSRHSPTKLAFRQGSPGQRLAHQHSPLV
jgi:hypothetical protein